jgi:hypothetical protein
MILPIRMYMDILSQREELQLAYILISLPEVVECDHPVGCFQCDNCCPALHAHLESETRQQ